MQLRWLGHATVLVELDGVRLLTDPVFGSHIVGFIRRRVPPVDSAEYAGVDAVLISHLHQDHLDLRSLRALGHETQVIVPAGAGRWLERRGVAQVEEIEAGQRISLGAVEVEATHAEHAGDRVPFGPRARALGYLVEGSQRLYFAGDTGLFNEMSALPGRVDGPLDVALLPVWGWGPTLSPRVHLDPHAAVEAVQRLAPRQAVPIHWGTYWPAGLMRFRRDRRLLSARDFASLAAVATPDVDVRVPQAGEEIAPLPAA